jgi:hypothetical protein
MSRSLGMKPVYIVRLHFKTPELEGDFNRWYNNVHLPDLLKVPNLITARRFISLSGGIKYLAIYEFSSRDGMMEGKNSAEMAACRADTRARWSLHLDPRAERYWCDVSKVFKSERDMLSDSTTLFLAFEFNHTKEAEAKAHFEEEIVGRLLKLPELETLVLHTTIFKEPEDLPNMIMLCQFQNKTLTTTPKNILEMLSTAKSRKDLYTKFDYALYAFMISIVKRVGFHMST